MSALPQAVRDWLAQQPSHVVQSFMLDLASRREGESTTGSIQSLPEAEEPTALEPKAVPAREPWEPPTEEEQALFCNHDPTQPSDEDPELQPALPETKPEHPRPSPQDDTELIKAFESFNLIDLEEPTGTSPAPTAIEVARAEEVPDSNVPVKAMPKPSNKLTDGTQPTRFNKQHAPPTATALPTTEPSAPPPGEDIWWTSRPITIAPDTSPSLRETTESLEWKLVGPLLGLGGQQASTRSHPVEQRTLGIQPRPSLLPVQPHMGAPKASHSRPASQHGSSTAHSAFTASTPATRGTAGGETISVSTSHSNSASTASSQHQQAPNLELSWTRAREKPRVRPRRSEPSKPHLQRAR